MSILYKTGENIVVIIQTYIARAILYKMGENMVVIFHIYVARAIFLLFYDDQDTESE